MADVLVVVAGYTAIDVHAARRNLTLGVLEVFQIERGRVAVHIHIDHAARLALGVKLIDTHRKLGAVGKVIGNGILAADVVTDLHRTSLHLDSELLEFLVQDLVEKDGLADLAELGMAVP